MKHRVSDSATIPGDLLDLRAFCLVVDLGSITAAAKTLGETKGSVSRRLARLEQNLGGSLVDRSPRLVRPTESGTAFRLRVGQALEVLDDAAASVQASRGTPQGRLRVTAPHDLAVGVFAPLVARFTDRYPEVKVEMLLTEKELDFDAHQIDVALRAAWALRDSSLIAHKLLEIEFGFVAAPNYLERHGRPRAPDELEAHRLLLFRGSGGQSTVTLTRRDDERHPIKLRLRAKVMATEGAFIRQLALEEAGIALLPLVLVERDLAQKRLSRVLSQFRVEETARLYLLHRAMQFLPPKIRAFRELVVGALAPRPPKNQAPPTEPETEPSS
jgi:DNA-binding transcriptional LysR family regulator